MGGIMDAVGLGRTSTKGITNQAKRVSQLSDELVGWVKGQYDEGADLRDAASKQAMKSAGQQSGIADQLAGMSSDLYGLQKTTFNPLLQGIVADANAYDSQANREAKARQAVAETNTQVDNAAAAMRAQAQARGVDVGSGNYLAQQRALAAQGGAAAAAAANEARNKVEAEGFTRKVAAAGLGANLTNQAQSAATSAATVGNSATTNAAMPVSLQQDAASLVTDGYSRAISGQSGAGSLQANAAGIKSAERGQDLQFLSNAMSSASNAAKAGATSDKNVKKNTGHRMNPAEAMAAIEQVPVDKDWQYDPTKGGPDDGGQPHTGPMAQDVQQAMGDDVAPDGKKIDLVSMNGILMAGLQHLNNEVKQIKKAVRSPAERGVF